MQITSATALGLVAAGVAAVTLLGFLVPAWAGAPEAWPLGPIAGAITASVYLAVHRSARRREDPADPEEPFDDPVEEADAIESGGSPAELPTPDDVATPAAPP